MTTIIISISWGYSFWRHRNDVYDFEPLATDRNFSTMSVAHSGTIGIKMVPGKTSKHFIRMTHGHNWVQSNKLKDYINRNITIFKYYFALILFISHCIRLLSILVSIGRVRLPLLFIKGLVYFYIISFVKSAFLIKIILNHTVDAQFNNKWRMNALNSHACCNHQLLAITWIMPATTNFRRFDWQSVTY